MYKEHKTWNEKMKLALFELEEQSLKGKRSSKKQSSWPEKEKVEEWNASRQAVRSCGQYCGTGSSGSAGKTKEEFRKGIFLRNVAMQGAKSAAFLLATIALIQGIFRVLPDSITVSNSVGGRELPIYCVETDKKQVALSFDAAWGNEDTAKILEILRKHNVKVTFFMTGGWVESYPDDVRAILADGD